MGQIKDLIEYLLNAIKIWIIIQPWQSALRVRFGKNIKILNKGIYFKIPYFDSIYVQENRLRVIEVPMQTCTTKDLKTITIKSAIGYEISNIELLYQTLYHPEISIINIAQSEIASTIYNLPIDEINPSRIEGNVISKLQEQDYGIIFKYFKITNFAVVRTYRLIQDQSYAWEGLSMDNKK